MEQFEISVSLFVIAYVASIVFALGALYVVDMHDVILPRWIRHGSLGLAVTLVVAYFLLLFGIVGLILSAVLPADLVFVIAYCAGFTSLLRREDGTSVWA